MKPQRIQLRRTKGFNLQAVSMALNGLPAVKVTRPGPYGNPFNIKHLTWTAVACGYRADLPGRTECAVGLYRAWMTGAAVTAGPLAKNPDAMHLHCMGLAGGISVLMGEDVDLPDKPDVAPLRGKNLACFCPLDQPCHGDVLLEIANAGDGGNG